MAKVKFMCDRCGKIAREDEHNNFCKKCREVLEWRKMMKGVLESGEVHYDEKGYPRCHICGKSFKKVLSHAWQAHGVSAKDYKREFGLDNNKGITCLETKEKLRKAIKDNYGTVVERNLINRGSKTRFKKGSEGRTRDKVREQTMIRLREGMPHLNEKKREIRESRN